MSLFSPLTTYYSQKLNQFLHKSQGICSLTKRDFFRLFWVTFKNAFTTSNIKSGWKKTGLYPFDPNIVLNQFNTTPNNRPSSSGSTHSGLTADNWRQVQKLLKETVADVYNQRAQLLTNSVMSLITENKLLQYRVDGLTKALYNKKKKRRRGKPLFSQLTLAEEGKTAFFSPNKIQQAQELQAEQE